MPGAPPAWTSSPCSTSLARSRAASATPSPRPRPRTASGNEQSRALDGDAATLDGATVVTYQTRVHPEQVSRREVPELEGEVRYDLDGDRWVSSEG